MPNPRQSKPVDLWQTAYHQLDERQQRILPTVHIHADVGDKENQCRTTVLIGEVIRVTEEQYEKYRQKADSTLRESSREVINAAISFKDIISAVGASDLTQHTAAAWRIVSLGLTVAKNHDDVRNALFESSEYLADVLTHCAFIEKKFYHDSNSSIKDDVGNTVDRLYSAILRYTAQIRNCQEPGMGRKILNCAAAITEHPLMELKTSEEKERDNLHRVDWISQMPPPRNGGGEDPLSH
ncbi:hypothetical protein BDV23DRAFT_180628 [Aspergillus alliaceus]|uniref:Fungal STAND N-terminal Goodbye domain-containing protein n=1 Tax=Petromyces alliaceus TaxID=209559 RepID=A0A5N7CJD7_PETAA|nr:hypothetical protein BDV23DRAFT_180628 [Aspergillus alliaceus]